MVLLIKFLFKKFVVKKVFRFYFFFLDMVVEVIIVSIDFKGVFVFFIWNYIIEKYKIVDFMIVKFWLK